MTTKPDFTFTECPRDAMQGIKDWIPTERKTAYLNALLKVGFDYLDFGSFVSPKAIPQMADTAQVLDGLELDKTSTKLLAIVANVRGAEEASSHGPISLLGYPLSVSETFQMRNVNKTIAQSLEDVKVVQELCVKNGKELQVYLSMGFGNPYGDAYSPDLVTEWAYKLHHELGINHIAPSDTIGSSSPETIQPLFKALTTALPNVRLSAHLHTQPHEAESKILAAWAGGCRHFDSAMLGFGGCPMAKDDLVGNMPTEILAAWFTDQGIELSWDREAYQAALVHANAIFAPFQHTHQHA